MGKWKAKDMVFVQLWNNDQYEPEKRNYTRWMMIFRTPDYKPGGWDIWKDEIQLTLNIEEGKVFLEDYIQANKVLENESEVDFLIQTAQRRFDQELDMGKTRSHFVYGYGGTMASLKEYDNPNIEYIPLIFPDNEKFQNARYKEKVEWSLIEEGAIFISTKEKGRYLAVIQRKNKPRDLKPFSRYITQKGETSSKEVAIKEEQMFVNIKLPKWLGESIGLKTENEEVILRTIIERETEKAVLIKCEGKTSWLPKSKITIEQVIA